MAAAMVNFWGYNKNRNLVRATPAEDPQKIIARMTNWQRNQWGKAGNPMQNQGVRVVLT